MRVILIDGDEDTRTLCEFILGTQVGWDLAALAPGPWAVERARRYRPDLILLGIEVPTNESFVMLRRLRMVHPTSYVPVIAITSVTDPSLRERIGELGAEGVIDRDFSMESFLNEVNRVVAQAPRRGMTSALNGGVEGGTRDGEVISSDTV